VRRISFWMILTALLLAVALAGCGQKKTDTSAGTGAQPAGEQVKLEVMVPCGMVGPMSEIIKSFEAKNPNIKVEWIPENMVTITRKILDGKSSPDVTMSMGDLEMDQLKEKALLDDSTRVKVAENSLCIMVPSDNPAKVQNLQDLTKPEVKAIAIPDPKENAVGLHAVEALKQAGIWDKVSKKVMFSQYAADSKSVAAAGQAQVSIGYYPCAVEVHVPGQPPAKPKNLALQCQLPAGSYPAFWCEAAALKNTKHPEEAKALLDFMQNDESKAAFLKWQFIADVTKNPPPKE
jgi:molybdate transport system substrate-binding protein